MKWENKRLADLGAVSTGSTPRTAFPHFYGGDIPFVTPADLDSGQLITATSRTLTIAGSSEARMLPEGAVMMCCIGTLGKIGIAGRSLATNQQINSVVFDQALVFPKYGYYACRLLRPAMEGMASATTLPIISKSKFQELQIPLPPLAEQKRIAAILDAADALRAKRREALAQLDALLQSSFLTLFGDPVANPMGWPMAAMGSQLKVIGGYAFKSEDFQEDGLPVIRISNLNKDSIDLDGCARIPKAKVGKGEKFRIIAGDTLIAMSGATTGKLGLVPDDLQDEWYLNQRVGAFRISGNSQIHREYLRALLASPFYQRHVLNLAGGAAQPNISGAQLESAEIPLPPLPLQQKFAAIVESIERQKTTQRAHLAELDALFAALQHRAFRGEL